MTMWLEGYMSRPKAQRYRRNCALAERLQNYIPCLLEMSMVRSNMRLWPILSAILYAQPWCYTHLERAMIGRFATHVGGGLLVEDSETLLLLFQLHGTGFGDKTHGCGGSRTRIFG
jgi:hypothetical protein